MFSVYGVTGQSFRGTLERLIAVPGLSAARRSRGIDQEGEELGPELRLTRRENIEAGQYHQAAQAYRQMLRASTEHAPILYAYQLMSRNVMTLRPEATVEEAWRQLAARGLGQAPVLDKTLQLVGQVSVQDPLTVINVKDGKVRDMLSRTVADVTTTPVVSEQAELVGNLTRSDILRALVNDPHLSLWA